jgi:hypothetical protein
LLGRVVVARSDTNLGRTPQDAIAEAPPGQPTGVPERAARIPVESDWNDILFASVLTNPDTKTLGPGLQYYVSDSFSIPYWNLLMAASLVVAVPAMVLFLVVQRYIVAGLAAGSLKG